MKAIITIKRLTEYATVVEMDEATFAELTRKLEGGRVERQAAEKDLNRRIDTKDWQDDDFHSLEGFDRFNC
jgi:archaellum component FlaC